MPKYRQLHTKIIDSFDFNEMPDDFTRVVWLLLTLILDSEGRGIDNMAWVRSKIFPLRQDVTLAQLDNAFQWLQSRKMIVRYEVEGKGYFTIPTFKIYQSGTNKEAPSNFPPPPIEQPTNPEPTPELLQTGSGATPPQSNADAMQDKAEQPALDPFDVTQRMIESVIHLPPVGEEGSKAIKDIMAMGATLEDIQAGFDWLRDNKNGKPIQYYSTLVGPTRTAIAKRLQGSRSNGRTRTPVYSEVHE